MTGNKPVTAFAAAPPFLQPRPTSIRSSHRTDTFRTSPPSLRRARFVAQISNQPKPTSEVNTSTEDTFAIDAGRDLFFAGMDAAQAIQILDADLGQLAERDDRFIAAERLKFFPSAESAAAIIRFVRKFNRMEMDQYLLEDRVARRKAVESLGRHKGAFLENEVMKLVRECLFDEDKYMVEVAVWALGEIGISENHDALKDVMSVLDNDLVEKRIVIQTLMRASYTPALPRIKEFMDSTDPAVASAAMTAVALFSSNPSEMDAVVSVLKSSELNVRRAAIEDITLSKFVPAMSQVAVCPNSIVLRSRAVRVLLDVTKESKPEMKEILDGNTAKLVDRLIWDHPGDLDLLGMKKETRKARSPDRNIRQLYKNDAIFAYLASRTLAEDHRADPSGEVGSAVLKSYNDLAYFDYFGAYHIYKTLGWLQFQGAFDLLLDNAENLPPRFFNHQSGAVTALAELGNLDAIPVLHRVAKKSSIWELKYACLIASERLGDGGTLRNILQSDRDWLVRARANATVDFNHLRTSFS